MGNEVERKKEHILVTLENAVMEASDVMKMDDQFKKTFKTAVVLHKIDQIVTPKFINDFVMPLQNSNLGFKTDKKDGYDVKIVKRVAVEALTLGLPISGNCINIIGGNLMVVKNGASFKVSEMGSEEEITVGDIDIYRPAIAKDWNANKPAVKGRAKANVIVEWNDPKTGERKEQTVKFTAAVNSGQDEDALEGKFIRKANLWLYKKLTNIVLPGADDDMGQPVNDNDISEAILKPKETPKKDIEEAEEVFDLEIVLIENNLTMQDVADFSVFKKVSVATVRESIKNNKKLMIEKIQAWRA